ncbi:hypothetical protein ACP4OV_023259 [Aristida adscensionis]
MVDLRAVMAEAAIGWLVQAILGSLLNERLEAWFRSAGLADDVERLKSDMRYVQMVLAAAEERNIQSQPLARAVVHLRGLLHDAKAVLLDLGEHVSSDDARVGRAIATYNTANSSTSEGTSAIVAHNSANSSTSSLHHFRSNLSSVFGKRKREYDIAANTHLGSMKQISLRIKDIAGKLRPLGYDVSDTLKLYRPVAAETSNLSEITPQYKPPTYRIDHAIFGRKAEVDYVRRVISKSRSNALTVLPIVGFGGAGKTTLAQLVFHHPIVNSEFQVKIWITVSGSLDALTMTRIILAHVCEQSSAETDDLNKLQKDLEKFMRSRRFLIVLDDVWNDTIEDSWEKLVPPFTCNQVLGNMIIVTTRMMSVARRIQTVQPVMLHGLEGLDFWLLFKSLAFGNDEEPVDPELCIIGKKIAQALRGYPLAAIAVGSILRRDISIDNWTSILDNEEFGILQATGEIMPALKLSYDYLPDHLQQCFRYCNTLPNHSFIDGTELVRHWISEGLVDGRHVGKTPVDIGNDYLAELVNSGFIRRSEHFRERFVMHDVMHDLAKKVSSMNIGP